MRPILAGILAFVLWNLVWVGSEALTAMLAPGWFGSHQTAFKNATLTGEAYTPELSILLFNLARGAVITLFAGFSAAVTGRTVRSAFLVGLALFVFYLGIGYMTWHVNPVWYHVLFGSMLIPIAVLGGKFRVDDGSVGSRS